MKVDKRFPLLVAGVFSGVFLVSGVPLGRSGDGVLIAAIIGATLSTLNVLAGFLAIEYSIGKPQTTLMKVVLGGMGIRMAAMLGILALLIKYTGLHIIALLVSMLGFYVVYLVLEIFYIQRRVSHNQQG